MYLFIFILDDNDELYIASDYPYRYSELLKFLSTICTEKTKDIIRKSVLCKSLGGNPLPMLILTNFLSTEEKIHNRPAIILTARVHPGYALLLVLEKLIVVMLLKVY